MILLINTASTFKGGSLQVARSFLEECRQFDKHEYHVILGASLARDFNIEPFPDNFYFYPIDYRPATRIFSLKPAGFFLKCIENEVKPDIIFTTSGPAYWRPKAPHVIGYNLPHYVYPDSPFWSTLPLCRRARWKLKELVIQYFFRHDADAYVVQTDDINRRLRRFLNTDKIFTVTNTFNAYYFQPKICPNKLGEREEDEFRLLTLSAWYPHKNIDIIKKVICVLDDSLRQRVRFVLTLPEKDFDEHFPQMYYRNIVNVGPVKIEEGPALYRECDALFLPTLLECFSASYAEAMAIGRPILTSDLDFAKTVCHDAAMYFDPMNPKDIANKISSLVHSKVLQHELIEKGKKRLLLFGSARNRAEQYLKICEEIVGKKV